MSMLKQYLANVEKTFKFRIKALFPLDDANMDLLEKALQQYRPVSVSKPTKAMFQTNPLGFTGAKSAEVYMCDVELTVPVSPFVLQTALRDMLGLGANDESLKVFGENGEVMNEPLGSDDEKHPALLTIEGYAEVPEEKFEDYYGDDYNSKFKAYLFKVEKERAEERGRGKKVDAPHPLTKWASQPTDDGSSPEQPK